jgi:hypothetical protein
VGCDKWRAGHREVPTSTIDGIGADELVGGAPSATLRALAAFSFADRAGP